MTQWGEDLKKEIENLDDDDFLLFVLDTSSSRIFLDLKQVDVRQTGQNKEYTIILSERWCSTSKRDNYEFKTIYTFKTKNNIQ